METPLQISFRDMETSPAVEDRIRDEVGKLSEFYRPIIGCRVIVEIPHQHRQIGNRFHVRIHLKVPGGEIVAEHEPGLHASVRDFGIEKRSKDQEVAAPHKDVYVAIRDAFKSARRQLEDFAREQRGDVKHHPVRRRGIIRQILPEKGSGYIETAEGKGFYFDLGSLPAGASAELEVGDEVGFLEQPGDEAPIALSIEAPGRKRGAGR